MLHFNNDSFDREKKQQNCDVLALVEWRPGLCPDPSVVAHSPLEKPEETTRTTSYYIDEDYAAGPEIQ